MSNVAKLKKQAAEFELKKQFDKALAIYIKLLEQFDANAAELDVALFNRVGDLMLRQGNVADAVDYYEQAIDRYADTGFFNNAIALCNKVLRHSPGRASVYYKLGKISAQKGFKNDAKVNFLEYADRMQKAGKVDESFRALKEFADLCPDQDEIRLTLADQLTKAERKPEAIEQFQTLYEKYESEGRSPEAAAALQRMRALDPTVEPRSSGGGNRKTTSRDLIFIDLDTPSAIPRMATPARRTPPQMPMPAPSIPTPPAQFTPAAPATPASMTPQAPFTPPAPLTPPDPASSIPSILEQPALITNPLESPPLSSLVSGALPDITRIGDDTLGIEKSTPSASVFGLESTRLADDAATVTPDSPAYLLAIEPTSIASEPTPHEPIPAISELESLESSELDPMALDGEPTALDDAGGDAEFVLDADRPPIDRSPTPTHNMLAQSPTPAGDLELIMPADEADPAQPEDSASIDFDLSELTPPKATPVHPTPGHRPTPGTARVALEGLPLMDFDARQPTPASTTSVTPSDPLVLSSDLELVDAQLPDLAPGVVDDDESDFPFIMDGTFDALDVDEEPIVLPTPSKTRKSTIVAAQSVELLKADIEGEPENWGLHRELAEAMLEAGDRDGGIRELELAMNGSERSGDLDLASAIAEEVARLEPDVVKHHQKRVEYAFRTNDRPRLVEAYVALADSLLAADQPDRARTVYQRVIDLSPDDVRARAALDAISVPAPEPLPPPVQQGKRRSSILTPAAGVQTSPSAPQATESFVNLGDWLRDSEGPKDTRMVVEEQEPTGDEDADFADMLRKFKQGVAENVDAEDYQSHYDLAIAFKEMGLLDEAIAEFQKALASPTNRLPTFESLGQCFLDKGQPKLATSILSRGLNEKASEDQLIGVLYLLGRAAEAQSSFSDAVTYYQRVFVLDIQFRDTADRLNELERAAR